MSQENQSCLRFSLEESLWFRKGQEVEELISISLDPDITIQENDQYVTIRGSLELTGEYKSYEASDVSEDEGFTSQKFVERVAEREEEGSCEFSHRFPVDITIPNNRIQSIYDIDVLVESFDYSLPERSCLKLSAELTISGLYGQEQQQQQEEEPEYEVLHRSNTEHEEEVEVEQPVVQSTFQENFLFEAEARKQQEEEEPVEVLPKFPTFNYQPQVEFDEEEEEEVYEPVWNLQEARSEGRKEPELEIVEEEVVVEVEPEEHHHYGKKHKVEEESSSSSSSEDMIKKVKKKLSGKKKKMTLTEFFARKDENTGQTKLKVCIVQKGDTVDTLADRYDVTVQNLLRINNLELNQDVYEGQVLYIPGALAKK
ncbi:stage VI sporulation protein D [Neobacillus sp. MM2021_6]|uniref:stage VI sporulation protein D n=1 Tax=Bacillaceae TaxID=186817 RepID=UPI0014079924|nr:MULTISPECIES: stage VI sporulation protein D [Bacillaceae]MBO0960696.1 stage VI sporulation protein D [Neobacillus sp. MM2021_6]NHC17382.1 stage VI sporulation protein D [Bacillus sp. MM2020_4]